MTQPLAPSRDAEDSPGSTASRQPLNIHREERRFLIDSGQAQRQALTDHGVPWKRTYNVKTLYLEPGGSDTWSIGASQIKFRLRQYNDETIWWFEMKTNVSGMVDKTRRQVTAAQIDRLGMRPMVAVTYRREEFERGSDALREYQEGQEQILEDWLRVTIDTGVTARRVPRDVTASKAMQAMGVPLATMIYRVLEVKSGQNVVPPWLPRPAEWPGSKSKFSIAAMTGTENMVAPAYTLRNPNRVAA